MPEIKAPPVVPDVDLEREPYLFEQEPDDKAALKLVKETFGRFESRRMTHERRWENADRLYHGVVDPKMWEGTDVPRASLPVPLTFDQVEAAYPIITGALFDYRPTFFDVSPLAGSTTTDAARVRDLLSAQFDTPFDETGMTPVAHMKIAVRQALKYGDGAVEISWDYNLKRTIVEWVDIRDLYMDPSTPGPLVDWSPAIVHRKLMTVEQLAELRDVDGVKIPGDEILNYLAKSRYVTSGDVGRQRQASARKEAYYVGDLRSDPRHQQVEVLVYWTKDRLIWTLGRIWTAINHPNPYGFLPYARAPLVLVEGRPHSISVADAIEGDQKYAQGIRNARLDNLALAIRPPRIRAAGTPSSPSATAWRPGLEDRVSSPKEVEVVKIENVTQDAYREEEIIHAGAAKRFGISDFTTSGTPTPSNANRSATGVTSQATASNRRMVPLIQNFEDYMIVPLLYKMQKLFQKFAPELIEGPPIQGQQGPKKSFLFRMEAASRMITQDRLAGFLSPVTQLLFNDAITHQANLQGRTIDFAEWERFFQDATGTSRSYSFFRQMSPQEMQSQQQPDPKQQSEMQKAMLEAKVRMSMGKMKADSTEKVAKMKLMSDLTETGEKSARDIIKTVSQERTDRWGIENDPGTETSDS